MRLSRNGFEFKNLIAIEYWFWYDLLKMSFQINIVFNDQRIILKILYKVYLSTDTATSPLGDYVQMPGVLQTGRQCCES